MRLTSIVITSLFISFNALAVEFTIPVKHLSDQNLTENYAKSMITDLSGYVTPAGLKPIKSKLFAKMAPGELVTVDMKKHLKVPTTVVATVEGESSSLESYSLIDPSTFQTVKSFLPDGEFTIYRENKPYPERMKVGELALLSKSETFNSTNRRNPIYKTTTLLSLVKVQGEADLFEFCETDYEYPAAKSYKKSESELSSCLLINSQGEIRGYAVLIAQPTSRSTYVGTMRIE